MSARTIVKLIDAPQFVPTVVQWIETEWPREMGEQTVEDRLCGNREPGKLPQALVGLWGAMPVGVVSLVYYEQGALVGRPYWIDAVYVTPDHRGQGWARELLREAEPLAVSMGIDRLFALTEFPDLYLQSGWEVAEAVPDTPGDVIVTRSLTGSRIP
jgi:GNAT superfamily N-acetyltransferase